MPGITWLYVSWVMPMEACPRRLEIGWRPARGCFAWKPVARGVYTVTDSATDLGGDRQQTAVVTLLIVRRSRWAVVHDGVGQVKPAESLRAKGRLARPFAQTLTLR
jgi:hypothetical protein